MSHVLKTVGQIVSLPVALAIKAFKAPKAPAAPVPVPTRDDAMAATSIDDALRRRRGSAADMLLGTAGAEAATTPTKVLFGE